MAVAGGGRARIATSNKIALESGAYEVTIVDEFVYFVTKTQEGTWDDGSPKFVTRYSKTPTDDQEIKISVEFDDAPEIKLETRMPFYLTKNSKYGKLVSSLTGKPVDQLNKEQFDSKALVNMKALAEIKFNGKEHAPYSKITEIRGRPKALRPTVRPKSQPTGGDFGEERFAGDDIDDEIPF